MDKFLKSIFQPGEKRKHSRYEGDEEDKHENMPPLDLRRKLSISRSGRMKQNKKRQSLSLDLYGDNLIAAEKPSSVEYHVKNPPNNASAEAKNGDKNQRRSSEVLRVRTPEEEIDSAFAIVDKS